MHRSSVSSPPGRGAVRCLADVIGPPVRTRVRGGHSAALVGSLSPTTIAGQNLWSLDESAACTIQRAWFEEYLAMIGGLPFMALCTPAGSRTDPSATGRAAS